MTGRKNTKKETSSSVDMYFCKACKVYIADNRAQRLQHEMGAKHKAAAAALVADIAKRNKEAAAKASREKAERDRAEIIANGGRRTVSVVSMPRQAEARGELLSRIADAAMGPQVRPETHVDEKDVVGGEKNVAEDRESTGYGQWVEVADPENSGGFEDAGVKETGELEHGLKRKIHAEATIGAEDAEDEEEALAKEQSAGIGTTSDTANGSAVVFKQRRTSGKNKRRKK